MWHDFSISIGKGNEIQLSFSNDINPNDAGKIAIEIQKKAEEKGLSVCFPFEDPELQAFVDTLPE